MNFHGKRSDEEIEIAIIPMVDVMLLLLIFFMLTTTFKRDAEIQIDLPEAKAAAIKKDSFIIEIAIDSNARFFVNQKRLKDGKVETLMSAIQITMTNHPQPHVVISSDRTTPYQAVVTAMDAVRQLGLNKFSLTTKSANDEK